MKLPDEFPEDSPPDAIFPFNLHGVSLEIPRSILTQELWMAFSKGYYEGSEIASLQKVVRPGDSVLEIGAGVGFISTFLLKALNASRVCAIEANAQLIPIINRTHALNGVAATVLQGVAGRRVGTVPFYHQAAFWASSVVHLPDSRTVMSPGIDIARVLRENPADVLVVDIEGGEQDLFIGLELLGVRNLVVEVHQPQIGRAGIARCFAALHDAGFTYDPDGSGGSNVVFGRFPPKRGRIRAAVSHLMPGRR